VVHFQVPISGAFWVPADMYLVGHISNWDELKRFKYLNGLIVFGSIANPTAITIRN
jgi:hypothetical protein